MHCLCGDGQRGVADWVESMGSVGSTQVKMTGSFLGEESIRLLFLFGVCVEGGGGVCAGSLI